MFYWFVCWRNMLGIVPPNSNRIVLSCSATVSTATAGRWGGGEVGGELYENCSAIESIHIMFCISIDSADTHAVTCEMRQRRCDAALHLWIHCIHDGCLSSRFTWPNTPRVKCLTLSAELIIISTGNNWSSITLRDFDRGSVTRGGTGREEFCDISVITMESFIIQERRLDSTARSISPTYAIFNLSTSPVIDPVQITAKSLNQTTNS